MKACLVLAAALTMVAANPSLDRVEAACTPLPQVACRIALAPIQSTMTYFQTGKTDADDIYTWAWHGGEQTAESDFGDPLTATDYAFCLYDSSARVQPMVGAPALESSGWKKLDNGFLYRERGDQRLRKLILRAKVGGRGKILAHGDFTTVAPVLPFVTPVIVQVQASNGQCWEADFVTPRRNDAHAFKATN